MRHRRLKRAAAFSMAMLVVGLSAGIYSFRSSGGEQGPSRQHMEWNDRLIGDGQGQTNNVRPDKNVRVLQSAPGEHPLAPCLRWSKSALTDIRRIKDYSCTIVKRERVGNVLVGPQYLAVKVRHEPFSVYMRFLEPAKLRGREVIYVQGRNNDKLLFHLTGVRHQLLGTVAIRPAGRLAMTDNRYPITELGIRRMVERLIDVGESDMKYGNCEVRVTRASLQDRPCTCVEVEHPLAQPEFLFHQAKIYVDDQQNVPLRYEAYDWPKEAGDAPALIEEYTYLDLKLNRGFNDQDFDVQNPDYAFARNAGSRAATAP